MQVSPTRNPVRNHSEYLVLYFLTFMVIAYFFIVNLFVGIIMDNFAEKRDELEGAHLFTTPEQQEWVQTIRESVATRPSKVGLWTPAVMDLAGTSGPQQSVLVVWVRCRVLSRKSDFRLFPRVRCTRRCWIWEDL